jgi:hypothetical protein
VIGNFVGAFVETVVGLAVGTFVGSLVEGVGRLVGWQPNLGASVDVVLTASKSLVDCVGVVEGKELMLGEVLGSTEGWGTTSLGERLPSIETVLADGAVATVGLVVISTGPSFDGAWVMEGTEASEVKPEVRLSTSEGLKLNLEVSLGPTETPLELKEGRNALVGLMEGSEVKLGDELGPELPEGTSCADVNTDKDVSNSETFIAVELAIAA